MTVQEGFPVLTEASTEPSTEPSADDVVVDPDHFGRSGAPGERAEPGRPFVRPARLGILIGLIVALGWWRGTSVLVVVAGVIVMIFLHELGHYVMARRAGMKVTEFMIGFGPRIWSFRRGDVEYGLKAIPAGAYVKIVGMANVEEVAPGDEPHTYRQGGFWARMGVAVAGSTMHFLVALVLLFLTFVFSGVSEPNRWAVGTLAPGSAAQNAGLQVGDRILAVGGVAVSTHEQMAEQARKLAGRETTLDIERDGRRQTLDLRITPRLPVYGTIGEDLMVFERAVGELGVSVAEGGAIEAQGLRDGDVIVRAGGTDVATIDELRTALEAPGFRTDGRLTLNVERDGTPRTVTLNLGSGLQPGTVVGFLGVGQEIVPRRLSVAEAVPESVRSFGSTISLSVSGMARFFQPATIGRFFERAVETRPGQSSGPTVPTSADRTSAANMERNGDRMMSIVGAVAFGESLTSEWADLAAFFIQLNIVIGVFNLIPLPPFDGGHVAIAVYERVREVARRDGRRYLADANKYMPIAVGVVILMSVIGLAALYLDIVDPVRV